MGLAAWLNGLAEAASELRRHLLDRLRAGETARGEELLEAMEDVYDMLVTIEYPDAITGGLRRATDALRAVVERSRADVTTTVLQAGLQRAIEQRLGPTGRRRPVRIGDLTTPALVVDSALLEHNLATMAAALPGARLRPHVKAHKCTALAARQAVPTATRVHLCHHRSRPRDWPGPASETTCCSPTRWSTWPGSAGWRAPGPG